MAGQNILRYLLFSMNNAIIKDQRGCVENANLSNLFLMNGCIPFDTMPFINSPQKHNPRLSVLFECIPTYDRKHELLARLIRNNTEIKGYLFTPVTEITGYEDIPTLARRYTNTLWWGHRDNSGLSIENGQIFINEYKSDTCSIIQSLQALTDAGVQNYTATVSAWLQRGNSGVECDEKKLILKQMFALSLENPRLSIIYRTSFLIRANCT